MTQEEQEGERRSRGIFQPQVPSEYVGVLQPRGLSALAMVDPSLVKALGKRACACCGEMQPTLVERGVRTAPPWYPPRPALHRHIPPLASLVTFPVSGLWTIVLEMSLLQPTVIM